LSEKSGIRLRISLPRIPEALVDSDSLPLGPAGPA
jgi:hypothetical protein